MNIFALFISYLSIGESALRVLTLSIEIGVRVWSIIFNVCLCFLEGQFGSFSMVADGRD